MKDPNWHEELHERIMDKVCRKHGHKGIPCGWSKSMAEVQIQGFVLCCERCGTPLNAWPNRAVEEDTQPPTEQQAPQDAS